MGARDVEPVAGWIDISFLESASGDQKVALQGLTNVDSVKCSSSLGRYSQQLVM